MMISAHANNTSLWKPLNLASSDSLWTSMRCMKYLLGGESVEREKDPTAFDPDGVAANGFGHWSAAGLAGANVEPALVQRAFDLVAFEKAFAQPRVAMRADVVGGEDLAARVVERDVAAGDDHADHVV